MSDDRAAVIRKFATAVPTLRRRPGYKGQRRQLGLRLDLQVVRTLHLIKLATGEDINTLCEAAIAAELERRMAQVRATYDEAAWTALNACADRAVKDPLAP